MADQPSDPTTAQPATTQPVAAASVTTSNSMVTVGCKLPNGRVIHLRGPNHPNDRGAEFTLRGANASGIIGGHGMTQVPLACWEQWVKENPNDPQLKSGVLFAHENKNVAEAMALERSGNVTGLEPMNPEKMPAGIQKADEIPKK